MSSSSYQTLYAIQLQFHRKCNPNALAAKTTTALNLSLHFLLSNLKNIKKNNKTIKLETLC